MLKASGAMADALPVDASCEDIEVNATVIAGVALTTIQFYLNDRLTSPYPCWMVSCRAH